MGARVLDDLPLDPQFDAVLCLLVTQFVKDGAQRQAMFDGMAARLKPGGYLVNAEISDDMSSAAFRDLSGKWKTMHRFAGATESDAENSVDTLVKHVAVVPPAAIERFLRSSGFSQPIHFFQSLLIHAWYSRKD